MFAVLLLIITTLNQPLVAQENSRPEAEEVFNPPLGLPPIPWPKDNPYSAKKAELGKLLFFDKRLSSDGTVSCASCHTIEAAFAEHKPVSEGIKGEKGNRNAPTVINSAYQKLLFWDGRAKTLEEQAKGPLSNPKEMTTAANAHEAYNECHLRIRSIPGYKALCQEAFGHDMCTIDDIAKAIATFERTVLSGNSPYDRYMHGDPKAMSPEAIKGLAVFKQSGCINCHNGSNFTDGRFLNIGVGMDAENPDLGRYEITKDDKDKGAFKTPTLREVAKTPPYMHDGSLPTLQSVIEYYDKGGIKNSHLNPLMRPLHLSAEQKAQLEAFLNALNGEGWEHFQTPKSFP